MYQCGKSKWKRQRKRQRDMRKNLKMQLLMDYLLSALYVMTMRNGHRATWIAWATVSGRGLDKQHRRRKGGREREKLELLPSSWS